MRDTRTADEIDAEAARVFHGRAGVKRRKGFDGDPDVVCFAWIGPVVKRRCRIEYRILGAPRDSIEFEADTQTEALETFNMFFELRLAPDADGYIDDDGARWVVKYIK